MAVNEREMLMNFIYLNTDTDKTTMHRAFVRQQEEFLCLPCRGRLRKPVTVKHFLRAQEFKKRFKKVKKVKKVKEDRKDKENSNNQNCNLSSDRATTASMHLKKRELKELSKQAKDDSKQTTDKDNISAKVDISTHEESNEPITEEITSAKVETKDEFKKSRAAGRAKKARANKKARKQQHGNVNVVLCVNESSKQPTLN